MELALLHGYQREELTGVGVGEALLPRLTLKVTRLCLLIVCVVTSSLPAKAGAVEVVKADYAS